jgi:release factor glutamine methyltransferase
MPDPLPHAEGAPPPATLPSPSPEVVARLRAAGCVFAEEEAQLLQQAAADRDELDALVRRRVEGSPLEHVVGWAEFCGLRILLDPGVFVPRPRTELMARCAIERAVRLMEARAGAGGAPPVVVDLCCGSGAVAAAVLTAVPDAVVHAADVDPAAVRCARRNLPGQQVHQGDLFDALPEELRGAVDVLAANVPYVPTDQIGFLPPEARDHEPRVALDGGPDGLTLLRRVLAGAVGWLRPGGHVLVEVSARQVSDASSEFVAAGLEPELVEDDELDARVLVGRRPLIGSDRPG